VPATPRISLDEHQRAELHRLVRTRSLPAAVRLRARAILLAVKGVSQADIARKLETTPSTVRKWVDRFLLLGVPGILHDKPRKGRPRSITPELRDKIAHDTVCLRPTMGDRWTARSMAAYQGLPPATVHRVWAERGIDPRLLPAVTEASTMPDIAVVRAAAEAHRPKPRLVGRYDVERVVMRVRLVGVPRTLRAGYRVFEGLLKELLVRGSSDIPGDVDKLLQELEDKDICARASESMVESEFGRVVATVAYAGPGRIDTSLENLRVLWPPMLPHQRMPVLAMAMHVQNGITKLAEDRSPKGRDLRSMLANTGKAWPVEQEREPRLRGRPKDEKKRGVYRAGARERLFDAGGKARRFVDVVKDIASALGVAETTASRAVKAARRKSPIPRTWKNTLLAKRLAPLHTPFFSTLATEYRSAGLRSTPSIEK
jgi:hypothetical protein